MEFAVALLALLLFFAIYMQFVELFIVHERLKFAGYSGSRTLAVQSTGHAWQTIHSVDKRIYGSARPKELELKRGVPISRGFRSFFSSGQRDYIWENRFDVFDEKDRLRRLNIPRGDN